MLHRCAMVIRLATAAALVFLVSGCAEIVARDTQGVSVDVGYVGELAPGTRYWFSWLQANEHCAQFGKDPKLVDLKGSVAIYRCVDPES